jgi:hypothetical protein
MLMVNGCTWAHCVLAAAEAMGLHPQDLVTQDELAAMMGGKSPQGVIIPSHGEG